jgi:methylmalonyl-CoA/ethylmalonyl-CoA epimerase
MANDPAVMKVEDGKIYQVCEVVRDLESTAERYWKTMGFGPWYFWDFIPPKLYDYYYKGVKVEAGFRIAVAQIGQMEYELTQPLFGLGIHRDFLDQRGEGIHHVKIFYKDIQKAIDDYRKKGIYVLQEGKFAGNWHVFLDTEKKFNTIWEIGNFDGNVGKPDKVYPE